MKVRLNREKIEYLVVFIAVLGMGSLYFQVLHMPLMAVMEVVAAGILLLGDFNISKRNFVGYFTITLFFLLTSIVNLKNGFYVNDLIIWCVNAFFIIVMQSHMTFESFKQKFVRIMVLEAIVSLFAKSSVITAIVNTILNVILVLSIGPLGAAISTAFAYFLMWAIRLNQMKKCINLRVNLVRDLAAYIILVIQAMLLLTFQSDNIFCWYQLAFVLIILLLYIKEIKSICMKLFKRNPKLS